MLDILEWEWEHITIDFVLDFPRRLRRFDGVWVIVYRLTKFAHFILVMDSNTLEQLAYDLHLGDCSLAWCTGFYHLG